MPNKKQQGGFTLIELLVVISIITLLASLIISSGVKARSHARDSIRLNDLHTLGQALEMYIGTYGDYPPNEPDMQTHYPALVASIPFYGRFDYSDVDSFIPALVTTGIMTKPLADPLRGYYYLYVDARDGSTDARLALGQSCEQMSAGVMVQFASETLIKNSPYPLCKFGNQQTGPTWLYCACFPK